MTQPKYLPQGLDFLGFLAKEVGDLRGITTLAHELIQNADDAKNEAGELSATRIIFDFTDDALVVSNDAVFREIDFERIRQVAGGSKRSEAGDRTTGEFGVGFISVYLVTDRPEIHSAGRRWILRPEKGEDRRIKELSSSTPGTVFKLPWAFEESPLRKKLKVPTVKRDSMVSYVEEVKNTLPRAILFLKMLKAIELRRDGELVRCVERTIEDHNITVGYNSLCKHWRVMEGRFANEASGLRNRFPTIDSNREDRVRLAIPHEILDDGDGVLFATLPTEQSTGLPFHIDADFFPASDRKSIAFEDSSDDRSEWNRSAMRAAASVVEDNLIVLRNMFEQDASTFWAILYRLYKVFEEYKNNNRKPLGVFWKVLLSLLGDSPIVYTQSGKWLKPAEVRITTGGKENEAVPAFEALGIETVHQDLGSYRNLLTHGNVGVETLSIEDIFQALNRNNMTGRTLDISPLQDNLLKLLWVGANAVLERTSERSQKYDEELRLLAECALAPAVDGRLWPCKSVYKTDEETCDVFSNLLPDGKSFLAEKSEPLLDKICREFDPLCAIKEMEILESQEFDLQANWRDGRFDPCALLRWFANRSDPTEDEDLRVRLAEIPVFPSTEQLRPLNELWLAGGFDDPLGLADIVDTKKLKDLTGFLRDLGARELTFLEYAVHYIPQAFVRNSGVATEKKHNLLDILANHLDEIEENEDLKNELASLNTVECTDHEYRLPDDVYFISDDVRNTLGDFVHYASLPEKSESRMKTYRWLGVEDRPRPKHVIQLINKLTHELPDKESVRQIQMLLKVIGKTNIPIEKKGYDDLKYMEWLPCEGDSHKWHKPNFLYAADYKNLFKSQAQFLDVSHSNQQGIKDFLCHLGVKFSPTPILVVQHLLECAKHDDAPPEGIYQWLNNNAKKADIQNLSKTECLRIKSSNSSKGRYLRPDQVYWGKHPFGRFRSRLDEFFLPYQNLLSALDIKETPDHEDAIQVLKELSNEIGHTRLKSEDDKVVRQCWAMLTDALEEDAICPKKVYAELNNVKCVPNRQNMLYFPSWMFFEDIPDLAGKFVKLRDNSIARQERVWLAMEKAGVRPVSEVVQGVIHETTYPTEDHLLQKRIKQRFDLIKTISDDSVWLDDIHFIRVDRLSITWCLKTEAFGGAESTKPESALAHLENSRKAIYFSMKDGIHPWSAIARELSHAIAPGKEVMSISPGLRTIIAAESRVDAITELKELGITITEKLHAQEDQGNTAESFEETPSSNRFDETSVHDRTNASVSDEFPPSIVDRSDVISPVSPVDGKNALSEPRLESVDRPSGVNPRTERYRGAKGTTSEPASSGGSEPRELFAMKLFDVQTIDPSVDLDRPVLLPDGGPRTSKSASRHTQQSSQFGRSGDKTPKLVTQWKPSKAAADLAGKFRDMVHGDYGNRCQVCGKTFSMPNGEPQVFVVHLVGPSEDDRTNHFGNLLGLCGWHYALMQYGQMVLLDPDNGKPVKDWKAMCDVAFGVSEKTDDEGNSYRALPIRFWNVHQGWCPESETVDEEIRYSNPHWEYLCKLLKT